jgi:hypothetical protein
MNVYENRTYQANRKNNVGTLSKMAHARLKGVPTPYRWERSNVYPNLRRIAPEAQE